MLATFFPLLFYAIISIWFKVIVGKKINKVFALESCVHLVTCFRLKFHFEKYNLFLTALPLQQQIGKSLILKREIFCPREGMKQGWDTRTGLSSSQGPAAGKPAQDGYREAGRHSLASTHRNTPSCGTAASCHTEATTALGWGLHLPARFLHEAPEDYPTIEQPSSLPQPCSSFSSPLRPQIPAPAVPHERARIRTKPTRCMQDKRDLASAA